MNILLIEADYKNKYPPMGLMKISTYHKNRGDTVFFFKGEMKAEEFKLLNIDRVYITTLFTFYYKKTVDIIKYYKKYINSNNIFVGGILASLMPEKLKKDADIENILTGLLTNSNVLQLDDSVNIDTLPLDYSILDTIEYVYPTQDNYISYTTRGCPNNCAFCAVPILEPDFEFTNNIQFQVENINHLYGEKRNLLLMDNNIFNLSEKQLEELVNTLLLLGFNEDCTYLPKSPFEQFILKQDNQLLHKRFTKDTTDYLISIKSRIRDDILKQQYNQLLDELINSTNQKEFIINHQEDFRHFIIPYAPRKLLKRYVDFNQGLEAARITPAKMKILSKLPLKPARIAFDYYTEERKKSYINAIKIATNFGVDNFSNYMLYNYNDRPSDLWNRINMTNNLARELKVSVFSFPMKYAPLSETDRTHIGRHWNKKYLQGINAILLVTKGVVARGESFFNRAFGNSPEEFLEILTMPKDFIIYRKYYEDIGLTTRWKTIFRVLNDEEKRNLLDCININDAPISQQVSQILQYYSAKYRYTYLEKRQQV